MFKQDSLSFISSALSSVIEYHLQKILIYTTNIDVSMNCLNILYSRMHHSTIKLCMKNSCMSLQAFNILKHSTAYFTKTSEYTLVHGFVCAYYENTMKKVCRLILTIAAPEHL